MLPQRHRRTDEQTDRRTDKRNAALSFRQVVIILIDAEKQKIDKYQ